MTSDPNEKIVLSKTQARQGTNRPRVIYVLAFGIALIIVAFVVASLFYHSPTPP